MAIGLNAVEGGRVYHVWDILCPVFVH